MRLFTLIQHLQLLKNDKIIKVITSSVLGKTSSIIKDSIFLVDRGIPNLSGQH